MQSTNKMKEKEKKISPSTIVYNMYLNVNNYFFFVQ